jgi:pimeloyl-ACP methyl ester carboxylesterase
MAGVYIEWIQKVQPKGPYHLAGWSFGGGLAFEIAQQLIKKGEEVALLVIIDTGMKSTERKKGHGRKPGRATTPKKKPPLLKIITRIFKVLGSILSTVKDVVPYLRSGFYALISRGMSSSDKKRKFSQAFDKIKGIALTTEFLQGSELAELATQEKHLLNLEIPSSMGRVLQLIPVHQKFGQQYSPEKYPGKIYLIRNSKNREEVEESGLNLYLGWEQFAEDGVELIWTPGSHASLFNKPDVETLANHLKNLLNRAHQEEND